MQNIFRSLLVIVAVHGCGGSAIAQTAAAEIAPSGKLRIGMNASNATLTKLSADGEVDGISVDLGKFVAERLGVPYEPVVYASAATYTGSFGKGEWDIIITGRNPSSIQMVDFTPDVVLIEYVFVAAPGREFIDASHVDRAGVKIGVAGNGSADVFLTSALKAARLVRAAGDAETAVDLLRAGNADVYGTITDTALAIANRLPGAKVVPGIFTIVGFSIAMPRGRSVAAQSTLARIVAEAKAIGIVQNAIDKSGLRGVRVAP